MNDKSEALDRAVQFVLERAERENKTVEEVIDELKRFEEKEIKKEQMQARDRRKQARAESNMKTIERTKRTHQLIKMGAVISSVLGRTLSSDVEIQLLFDFFDAARTADGKGLKEYFSDIKDNNSSLTDIFSEKYPF